VGSKIKASRYSSAGNTFFVINLLEKVNLPKTKRVKMVRKICNDFVNFKTDGVIFLEKSIKADFKWDFYNSDGSSAEMCGNASRAVSHFYFFEIQKKKTIKFETKNGILEAKMKNSKFPEVTFSSQIAGAKKIQKNVFFVNSGVPHVVVFGKPSTKEALKYRWIKIAESNRSKGSNVTFVYRRQGHHCEAVTFERGVENFTLACGTGALAAAKVLREKSGGTRFRIHMPGGNLDVYFDKNNDIPTLKGPVKKEAELELHW
jgi:diaminopimelate epimerase